MMPYRRHNDIKTVPESRSKPFRTAYQALPVISPKPLETVSN